MSAEQPPPTPTTPGERGGESSNMPLAHTSKSERVLSAHGGRAHVLPGTTSWKVTRDAGEHISALGVAFQHVDPGSAAARHPSEWQEALGFRRNGERGMFDDSSPR